MKRMIVSVMTVVSMVAMLALSSCTVAGMECGLIGKWEIKSLGNYGLLQYEIEFKNDDTLVLNQKIRDQNDELLTLNKTYEIEKADSAAKTITFKDIDEPQEYELNGDSLKIFNKAEFKRVK